MFEDLPGCIDKTEVISALAVATDDGASTESRGCKRRREDENDVLSDVLLSVSDTVTVTKPDDGCAGAASAELKLAHRASTALALAVQNAHARDARVRFVEEGHLYFVDDKVVGLSVTGLIHCASPEDFNPFAAIAKMKAGRNWPNPAYSDTVDGELIPWKDVRIKDKWAADGALACALGTDLHGKLELHLNGEPVDVADGPNADMFKVALEWWAGMQAEGYVAWRTEMLIFHEEADVAGSIDFIAWHPATNTFAIIDWKRCSVAKAGFTKSFGRKMSAPLAHVDDTKSNKWALQVNIYREILEEKYGWNVSLMCMVVCHPENAGTVRVFEFERSPDARTLLETRIMSK